MKKLLTIFMTVFVLVTLLSVSAMAKTVPFSDDYVGENDIVFASINGVKSFIGDLMKPEEVEDACYWLADYADKYNIKFVGFLGRMSSGANFKYGQYCTTEGHTQDELFQASATDKELIREFRAVRNFGQILTDAEVPYGISLHKYDYYSEAFSRGNFVANEFTVDDFTGSNPKFTVDAFDANSFAVVVEEGDTKYIVYLLEAYPRLDVINWFNSTNAKHPDKRAFVFTNSFVDSEGNMYQQWDAQVYTILTAPNPGNSDLVEYMVLSGKPHDGTSIWKHAFSKHDNIVMVMSANANVGKDIVTSTFKNDRGYEMVSIVSNLIGGYEGSGAYPVLIKFSEENKTLDLRYAVPYADKVGGYIEESVVTVKLNKLAKLPDPDPVTLLPKIKPQANGDNTAYINGYAGNVFKPNANMTKAEASIIFARLLENSQTIPTGNTTRFADVKAGDWFYDAIAYLDTLGFYFTNTSDKYNPNVPITRAEFVELAYFASDIAASENITFKDVPADHKYYDAIIAAAAAGLVNGYEDKTFRPDATITRAEVVTIINRMLGLAATKDTISVPHLSNVFSDIKGHWAEYQVLMASNSKAKSENFFKIDPNLFEETPTSIIFENDYLRVKLGKKNGKVEDAIYVPTGESVFAPSATPWFTYAKSQTGATLEPTKLELVDGRLKFTYKGGAVAYFIIESHGGFFTVALDSNLPKNVLSLTFANIDFDYSPSEEPGSFRASLILMDTRVNHSSLPGGYKSIFYGTVRTDLGVDTIGSKVGICFSTLENHRENLKRIVDIIDPNYGIMSNQGGAYAYDTPMLYGDYAIVQPSNIDTPEKAEETAKLLQKHSFDQIDLHYSTGFINIDTEGYKEKVTDIFHKYGIKVMLHTYSSCLSLTAKDIISDPKWIKDIAYNPTTYTVRGEMSKFRNNIKTYEDATPFVGSSSGLDTLYLLIDEEIIRVNKGTTSGFIDIARAQLGTKAAVHEDGAEIRQLRGMYGALQPQPGSPLFYFLAEEVARIYNEGGFDMIYLDAFETLQYVIDVNSYYHYAEFYRTVLKNCHDTPPMEDSASPQNVWVGRGRSGALDSQTRGIRSCTLSHSTDGYKSIENFRTSTLGWFHFDPDGMDEIKNTINKTIFHDDFDFMGYLSIARDQSNAENGLSVELYSRPSRQSDNVMYYSVYSRLRKGNYFAPEVKEALRNGKYEYKLLEKDDGSFVFVEMKYNYNRIYDLTNNIYLFASQSNPFKAQTPFIRIEQRYSTLSENEKLVLELNENAAISSVAGKKSVSLNLNETKVLKVKVYGNGSSTGGILISLGCPSAHIDYYVPTSHTGWKEFILLDADNADHPGGNFSGLNYVHVAYDMYRNTINFGSITSVNIILQGDVNGVKIDDIKAYSMADASVKNPTITVGNTTMTFNTEIKSGEFIEYYPEFNKAYLNYYVPTYDKRGTFIINEAHTKEITFTGLINVPQGQYSMTYSVEPLTEAPTRAEITFGFYGSELANPAGWEVPEIDMGEATLDIKLR